MWRLQRTLLGLLYPPTCAFCDEDLPEPDDEILLCEACRGQLTARPHTACRRCGATVDAPADAPPADCPRCRPLTFHFSQVMTLGIYRAELRTAVLRLKRAGSEPLAAALGGLLVDSCRNSLDALSIDRVTAAPMHWRRRLSHGTDGPELIATAVARRLKKRYRRLLTRTRHTAKQTDVAADERAANVRGAFQPRDGAKITGQRILLIDDILTTGATANEAAATLLKAGAAAVHLAVIARAESAETHF